MTAFNSSENERVRTSKRAIAVVKKYEESRGWKVSDEQTNANHKGYDLLSMKDGITKSIEVKGTCKPNNIPNAFSSEFKNGRLVADYLYVVYFITETNYKLYIIPQNQIMEDDVFSHYYYKFTSSFINELNNFEVKETTNE